MKMDKLDIASEIVIYCGVGVRASQTHRILRNAGFENTKFMEGSISAWPYKIEK